MIRVLMLMLACLTLSACVTTQFECGERAYQEGEYRRSFVTLQPLADKGDDDAQYALAYMYYYGQGVVENKDKALEYFFLAANQGHIGARKAIRMIKTKPTYPAAPSANPKKRPL